MGLDWTGRRRRWTILTCALDICQYGGRREQSHPADVLGETDETGLESESGEEGFRAKAAGTGGSDTWSERCDYAKWPKCSHRSRFGRGG